MNLNSIFQDTNSSTNKNQNQNQNQIYIFTKQHTTYYLTAYKMYLDNKFLGEELKIIEIFVIIKIMLLVKHHVLIILIIRMFKY